MKFNHLHAKHYFLSLLVLITVFLFSRPVSAKTQRITEKILLCSVKTQQETSGVINGQPQSNTKLGQTDMSIKIERIINNSNNDEFLRVQFYGPSILQVSFFAPLDTNKSSNKRDFGTEITTNNSREGLISFSSHYESPLPTIPSAIFVDIDRHTGIIQGSIIRTLLKAPRAYDTTEFHGTCRQADPKQPLF